MTRSFLVVTAFAVGVGIVSSSGCGSTGVGDPCTPEQEYNSDFNGFNKNEVNVESKSFQCQTRLCLVNHFQGRVTCPYGQDATGAGNAGHPACKTPVGDPITGPVDATGKPVDPKTGATVKPQCTDRTTDKAVYCSCRCANLDNRTDDGANYCKCPDGFTCTQLVTSIGQGDTGLTGAYCIKQNTDYQGDSSCTTDCAQPNQKCD